MKWLVIVPVAVAGDVFQFYADVCHVIVRRLA